MKLSKFAKRVLEELVEVASNNDLITYKELSERLGVNGSRCLYRPLGSVSEYTYNQLGIFISVLVVDQKDRLPGVGFTNMVKYQMECKTLCDEFSVNHIKCVHGMRPKELTKLLTVATY